MPLSAEGWKETPWGQGVKWGQGSGQTGLPSLAANKPANEDKFTYKPWVDPKDEEMAQLINWVANYWGLDPQEFQRQIQIESGYDPTKVSPKGAVGLGQLMPGTAAGLKVKDPLDPYQNLMGAAKLMKAHLDATGGDIRKALWRYNAGEGNFAKGKLPLETRNYIRDVTREPLPDNFGK